MRLRIPKPLLIGGAVLIGIGGMLLGGSAKASSDRGGSGGGGGGDGSRTGPVRFSHEGLELAKMPASFTKGRKTPRPITNVDTIEVHQTAVKGGFGLTASQLAAAGGDPVVARAKRYQGTPYHAIYSPTDRWSRIQWPPWAYTWHGNGGNSYSIGWAYDGGFPGDVLDVEGARASLRDIVKRLRAAGVPLKFVEAHRQHSADRAGDPGREIWSRVVVPLLAELGLEERRTHTTGSGNPIPDSWSTPP
jgi:hypothetical protein